MSIAFNEKRLLWYYSHICITEQITGLSNSFAWAVFFTKNRVSITDCHRKTCLSLLKVHFEFQWGDVSFPSPLHGAHRQIPCKLSVSLCPKKHAQTARFAVFPITDSQQMLKKAHIRYVTRAFYAFSFTFLQHICNVPGSFGDLTTNQLHGFHSV